MGTCTVSVLRGTSTDDLGDTVDTDVVVYDRLPCSIMQRSVATTRAAGDRPQSMIYFNGRINPRYDVRQQDRLRDEITGTIYLVTAVSRVASPITTNDTRLDLELVSDGTLK